MGASEHNLNDLDYCYVALENLKILEKNCFTRNETIRVYEAKMNHRRSMVLGAISLILPLLILASLIFSKNGLLHVTTNDFSTIATRVIGLVMLCTFLFLIVFIFLQYLLKKAFLKPLRAWIEKDLAKELAKEIATINQKAEEIVSMDIFNDERIPEEFMSIEMIPLIIRYFEKGQVSFLEEALYTLKLEIQNSRTSSGLASVENLLHREKSYLEGCKNNGGVL